MPRRHRTPSFIGLTAASDQASRAARGASAKADTRCELLLRRELFRRGYRYRVNDGSLPGKPDIVFAGQRVLVFCDGDFWHGRNLRARLARLKRGHNSEYWLAKIKANVARDITRTRALEAGGWTVLRFWESDISASPKGVADAVERILKSRKRT